MTWRGETMGFFWVFCLVLLIAAVDLFLCGVIGFALGGPIGGAMGIATAFVLIFFLARSNWFDRLMQRIAP